MSDCAKKLNDFIRNSNIKQGLQRTGTGGGIEEKKERKKGIGKRRRKRKKGVRKKKKEKKKGERKRRRKRKKESKEKEEGKEKRGEEIGKKKGRVVR